MRSRSLLFIVVLLFSSAPSFARQAPNAVTEWSGIVQSVIHNAAAPRSAGTSQILHAMVQLAVYDAVIAITGGFDPYALTVQGPADADVRAAVASAAYHSARPRIAASQQATLDARYAEYLATIADGPAKADGISVGQLAANALLALRANDGFSNVVLYQCSAIPPPIGEFEPDAGCPTMPGSPQPVDVKAGQILPFTFEAPSEFRPDGPSPMASDAYVADFIETRDYGRLDSIVRSAEQTDIAYFWTENPYVHWQRNLANLVVARQLSLLDSARFFAMVNTAAADAIIAGFDAKYFYSWWRPRTAIPLAQHDGNPATDPDTAWKPLVSVNHPEYPSGHGFWSAAVLDAVAAFFGTDKVAWTIVTSKAAVPKLVKTERSYDSLKVLMRDIADARVWGGLHWRQSIKHGEQIGRHVAKNVTKNFFTPTARRNGRH